MRGWGSGCACADHRRRLFTGALLGAGLGAALPAAGAIPECKRSGFTKAVSADQSFPNEV